MDSFQWSNKYLTGLTVVDEQHHILVDIINEYGNLIAENDLKPADSAALLIKLTDYADYHFKEEEKLMLDSGIDHRHFQFQQNEHACFIQQVRLMSTQLDSDAGFKTEAKYLLDFLINWLAYHILGIDQNMARQLEAITSGVTPENAYLLEEKNRSESTEPLLAALTGLFQQLSERNRTLQEMNKTLETKVQERTQELLNANLQLEKIAMTDVLTELPNRRYAMDLLQK